jgi:hypothetical protein
MIMKLSPRIGSNFPKRILFTLAMILGLGLGGLFTNTFFEQITQHWLNRTGFSPDDLWYLRVERMFSSAFVTGGGKTFWEAVLMVLFVVGLAEWMTGWKRTAATFWVVHLLVLVLSSIFIALLSRQFHLSEVNVSETARDVGPSAGYFACLGLVSSKLKRPWDLASGAGLFVAFLIAIFLPPGAGEDPQIKFSADIAHLMAFPLGWLSLKIIPPSRKEKGT